MKKPVKGTAAGKGKSQIWKNIYRSRYLYLLFALPLLYFIVFKYGAMAWLSIAFFDYISWICGQQICRNQVFQTIYHGSVFLEHPEKYGCPESLDAGAVFPDTDHPGASDQ